ncbi:uncharacterized protein LOC110868505 isoform X3 [Helianthus annuus]|uniref:uncharacterized protein LOC110868505 isoform X3 n=1 Tax=Helianthus annuus TaxID=4232 RepID=UPI000B8F6EF9|nr:uncharacterized protein LOC110868505 isoform X3 [Helianthus annuus]
MAVVNLRQLCTVTLQLPLYMQNSRVWRRLLIFSCFCKDQKFLHNHWEGTKGHKICTSCVLFANKNSFCPTCFDIIAGTEELIECVGCKSNTHVECVLDKDKPSLFECLTCKSPKRLVFDLKLKELKGTKVMDKEAALLLLTAAKIVKKLISKALDEAVNAAAKHAADTISVKKKASEAVERFMKLEDRPSLLDPPPETSRETGRLQRLSL